MQRGHILTRDSAEVAPDEFRARYFDAGHPVLLRGFLRSWTACAGWTPAAFAARYGAETVEVMRTVMPPHNGRHASPYLGIEIMTMAAFAALCEGATTNVYLVAQSQLLRRAAFSSLGTDMAFDPSWFDARQWTTHVSLWMGPKGTVTPLHFDLQSALLAQVYGRKHVVLAAPSESSRLYKGSGGYSPVDPEQPDLETYPLFGDAALFEATLERGDALFLPHGWWHHVRALTASISLSMSNFAWTS
jgi:Cupin-like domain